jgi:apolipoprotein N-acyltransferase
LAKISNIFYKLLQNTSLHCFLLGAFAIIGFAPFYLYPCNLVALAGLFNYLTYAKTAKQASFLTYCFGLGFFCAGVNWIYISLHDFGGMPLLMASFATFSFCAFLALFTACMGWLSFSLSTKCKLHSLLISAPLSWVFLEWVRSWIFTGFPWLNMGYSTVPNSALAGFVPIFGVYGVSLIVAISSGLLVMIAHTQNRLMAVIALLLLWLAGGFLKQVEWSKPLESPFSVALLQGNIAQDVKWQAEVAQQTLDQYLEMIVSANAQLIITPETALPILSNQIPDEYLKRIKNHAQENHGDVLIGIIESEQDNYYNSMLSVGTAPIQTYRKSHLVPFGEFIPLKSAIGWIYRDWLNMPLSDLSRGSNQPQPMNIAGQQVAINICYEDVYGEEIIRQLPQATLLVNTSNMAWFGDSLAPDQHLQMSQTRALESGRMMLRATNTGSTAIIDPHGHILSQLTHFTNGTLTGEAQGYTGETPYVGWGNWGALVLGLMLLGLGLTKKCS